MEHIPEPRPEPTQGLSGCSANARPVGALRGPAWARSRRNQWVSLLVGILCLLVYNANLRSISAGDTYPARYLPLSIWHYRTLMLDPVSEITLQGRRETAFWMLPGRNGHTISLYPVVVPAVIAPLYLPAMVYLKGRGWDRGEMDRVARIMEKLAASLLAAMTVALMYLLLRRRTEPTTAILLTLAFAFGTTTWVISSQALWQHGLGELLIVGMLLLLTGPRSTGAVLATGFLCGLIAGNRPPDSILAVAFGIYGISWARRLTPLLVGTAALSVGMVVVYNLTAAGKIGGAYFLVGNASFFRYDLLSGLAGMLISPTHGLFVFSPFLLFLPCCLPQVLRDRGTRRLTITIGVAALLQLLIYAKADWRQGASWGPRWLTDMLPVLIWMLPPVVDALRSAGRIAFVLCCGVAVVIQSVGAFWYTGVSDAAIFATAAQPMRAAWNPRNAPFIAELRHRRAASDLFTDIRGSIDGAATVGEVRDAGTGEEIDLAGWALADGHSPSEVIAILDGEQAGSTGNFFARPEVTRPMGATERSGWRIKLQPHNLTAGTHVVAVAVRAYESGNQYYLSERRFMMLATKDSGVSQGIPGKTAPGTKEGMSEDLAGSARRAAAILTSRQQAPGYWLTAFTNETRFQNTGLEMNTFLTSLMVDVLNPVAGEAGLGESLERARNHLSGQIEAGGLVRYHGRPDAPTIGTLGCAITPDSDDTSLVWRIAPGGHPELLPAALATVERYRTPEGLYRTWLAPREEYQCIDPGKDPNPPDVAIQMHILMLLAQANPPAARDLCRALGRTISEDRLWVYYHEAPLVPILRQADLQKDGCVVRIPPSRLRTAVPGQEVWVAASQLLQRIQGAAGSVPSSPEVVELLRNLSQNEFSSLRSSPPLLYHNDLTGSVRRFYWSEDVGYALWLRLYFENSRHRSIQHIAKP
jgi:hypothetical protein